MSASMQMVALILAAALLFVTGAFVMLEWLSYLQSVERGVMG